MLPDLRAPARVGEDDVHQSAAAVLRQSGADAGQQGVARIAVCHVRVDGGRVCHEVVEGAVLVARSAIMRQLLDRREELLGGRRAAVDHPQRPGKSLNEGPHVEPVELLHGDAGHGARGHLRRGDRRAAADHDVHLGRAAAGAESIDEGVEIRERRQLEEVPWRPLAREHPADLPEEVAILGLRQQAEGALAIQVLAIRSTQRLHDSRRHGGVGKAGFDPAERVDERRRLRFGGGEESRAGRRQNHGKDAGPTVAWTNAPTARMSTTFLCRPTARLILRVLWRTPDER